MTPTEYRTLRASHGSQRVVAARMGLGFRTVQRLEKSSADIPQKYVTLIMDLRTPKAGQQKG